MVTKYPKGDKAAAALWAQGNLFVDMGDSPDARLAFSKLIREYPSSEEAARALFGESRLPTLVQYDPISRFFESTPEGLLFSGDNGIPLVRYNILDTGGLISYDDLLEFLAR